VLKPYDDAATIESKGVKAPVVAWLTDPMDLQFLQIQGSGASNSTVAVNCASPMPTRTATPIAHRSLAGGARRAEERRRDHGRDQHWAKANPTRIPELLGSNPSYVFFTRPDSNEGPRGSLNVPLTAGYSVAVDRKVIPLGSLLWLSTTKPDGTRWFARGGTGHRRRDCRRSACGLVLGHGRGRRATGRGHEAAGADLDAVAQRRGTATSTAGG
jgi:membrane-bound lytic murein transglycosylase A